MESIYKFVAKQRDSYRSDTIQITEGYCFSQFETLRTVELYDNDRFLSGNKDSLDLEKPFFNIASFARTPPPAPRTSTPKTYRSGATASPRRATPRPSCSISGTATG